MALRDNLVAYWKGENTADALGVSTLTNNNSATFTSGKLNNAFTLVRASSQYLSVASNPNLVITGDMTISCWVKMASRPSTAGIISKYDAVTASDRAFLVDFEGGASGRFKFYVKGTLEVVATASNFGLPALDTWYHIIAQHRNGVDIRIKVNDGTFNTTSHTTGILTTTEQVQIGLYANGTNYFDGQIDDVAIWNRVLSDAEITELYNSGTGLEVSLGNPNYYYAQQG